MFRKLFNSSHRRPAPRLLRKLMLEALEDRLTPSGYSLTNLGSLQLGGDIASGTEGINNSGQIVGSSASGGAQVASLYANGQVTKLGTLPATESSSAYGINDSGQIVGTTFEGAGKPFLYSNGQLTDLNSLVSSGSAGLLNKAIAINDSGQIVGVGKPTQGSSQAFLYSNGTVTYLGSLGGTHGSSPTGINASGQVVGFSDFTDSSTGLNTEHAFLYSNGKMTDLGTLADNSSAHESVATAINNSGQIVGYSQTSNTSSGLHAFLYSNGTMQDLGAGEALAINASGQIVGVAASGFAALYSNGTWTDLKSLLPAGTKVTLAEAVGINDNGQILAKDVDGGSYLLTPQTTTETIISNGTVSPNALTASNSGQQVTVSATVNTNGSPATTGNVVFSLVDSNGTIVSDGPTGVAIGSNGQGSDTLTVPGGTAAGSYSLQVAYTDNNQTTSQTFADALTITPSVPTVYSLTDLGALTTGALLGSGEYEFLGGSEMINSAGQVIGNSSASSGSSQALLYSNGETTNLGTLGGFSGSEAVGINNSGQVVGSLLKTTNGISEYDGAFLYTNGQMTQLNGLDSAAAINDNGQIAGYGQPSPSSAAQAALYSNGTVTYLGSFSSVTHFSEATGINASGQVVGFSDSSTYDNGGPNTENAFLYSNGKLIDLGTLPGDTDSQASAINSSGQVVGESYSSSTHISHAFLYSNGQMTDLGTLAGDNSSEASAINSSGQVVGESGVVNNNGVSLPGHAFLYSNGRIIDLNSLLPAGATVTLTQAVGINDNGQIVASGSDRHLYLLTPQQSTGTVISNGTVSPNALTASNSGQQVTVSATVNTDGSPATAGNVVFSLVDSNGTIVSDGPTGVAIGSNGQGSDTLTVPGGTAAGSYSLQVAYTNDNQTTTQTFTDALTIAPSISTVYSLTDLGMLPGYTSSQAHGINSAGQVVGELIPSTSGLVTGHAFLYSNGQMTDLGTLPGDTASRAKGINTSGQVVGQSYNITSNGITDHAFLYSNGQMTELPLLEADAINDSGQIAGQATNGAALYSNGTVTYLGSLNSVTHFASPTGINTSGQVVGFADSPTFDNGGPHTENAFLYSDGKMIDLGTLPGDTGSSAHGINDSGQVVGGSSSSNTSITGTHAFLYSDGQMTDLGTLPGDTWSVAEGINSSGQVVGESGMVNGNLQPSRAFLYNNGQMIDLNSLLPSGSTVTLTDAVGINDNGQILATGDYTHLYLLTPQQSTGTVISDGIVSPNALTASNSGQQVTVSATVNTNGSPATTGNVVFSLVDSNGTVVSDGPTGVAIGSGGQASDTLTVPAGTAAGSYSLSVAYTNNSQTATQAFTGALTINAAPAAPIITANPSNQSVTVGQTATFTATASGSPTPTVQWQVSNDGGTTWSNTNLPSSTLITLPNVTLAENGLEVRAIFTNSAGSATTSIATLTIAATPPSPPPPSTPAPSPAPSAPNLPDQIQQLVQDVISMWQSLSNGDIGAFSQALQDYESLLVTVELEIVQIVLNDLAQLLNS